MSSHCKPIGASQNPTWRELYFLALFEPDKTKANGRITEAVRALVLRELELFRNPTDALGRKFEREEINSALIALCALKKMLRTQSV